MRRTLAALEVSERIRKGPISPVRRTWVPPQSSREWLAVPHLDHPHDVAVLLPEERHRAEPPRLGEGRLQRVDGFVAGDPLIDAVLDVGQLLRREGAAVGEVEAQLVWTDVGACLAHVGAQALAQGRLKQVGRGVVGLRGVPETVIDRRGPARAAAERPARGSPRAPGPRRRRSTSSTTARQSPSSHSITPRSETWPPPAA